MPAKIKLVKVKVSDIKEGERYRKDLGLIEELAENVREHGIIQPISVSQDMELIAGGRRLAAAKLAGLEEVDVLMREVGSELDLREIELIENLHRLDLSWVERAKLEWRVHKLKQAEGRWSQAKTAEMLDQSVGLVNRHLQLAEALEIIPELAECATEDEAWKTYKKIQEGLALAELLKRAKGGSAASNKDGSPFIPVDGAWRYANNHYMIGDALEKLSQLDNGVMDFAEVDPPYGVDLLKTKKGVYGAQTSELSDYTEVPEEEYAPFINKTASEVFRILKMDTFCIWWFAFSHYQMVYNTLINVGFSVTPTPAVWVKPSGQSKQPQIHLASAYEPFFIARKGRPAIRKAGRINVFSNPPVSAQSKIHPTERPVALMREILQTFAYPGMYGIIPFMGSGATLRAMYKEDMVGFGWDLSEEYKAKFIMRVEEEMGGKIA